MAPRLQPERQEARQRLPGEELDRNTVPMKRKLFAFVVGLVVLGTPATAQAPHAQALAEPAASPVRSSPAVADLRAQVDRLIEGANWRNDEWSVLVVSLDRGDTLYARHPDRALAPASNIKLFTTAAALYFLGPEFRFNTFLFAGGPVDAGVLEGDLVLYGTGDPTISDRFGSKLDVFRAFADTLAALGVHEVRGDVIGDASYFEGSSSGEGWNVRYINASYAAPASALSFAENIAMVRITPASEAGQPPIVDAVPGGQDLGIVNEATTTASGSTRLTVTRTSYDGPLVVRGRIARNAREVVRYVPVADPARYAAAALRELLDERGIVVTGTVRSVTSPAQSRVTGRTVFAPAFGSAEPLRVIAIHQSPPLREVLEIINKQSHNMMAEQTIRTVGRVAAGAGTVEGGARAVSHVLEQAAGSASLEFHQADGSGLSVLNRSSAGTLISLLSFMRASPMWEEYRATLPEAGARDGLRRMQRTPAAFNLRAKTGTIERVSALSGYVTAANGEVLAFSIISNNVPSTWRAKRIEDEIGAALAGFTRPGFQGDVPAAAPSAVTATPEPEQAPAEAAPEPAQPSTHVIQPGDTFDGIAKQYNTTVSALRAANPGLNPRRLIPGRTIRVR